MVAFRQRSIETNRHKSSQLYGRVYILGNERMLVDLIFCNGTEFNELMA